MKRSADLRFIESQPLAVKHFADHNSRLVATPEALRVKRHVLRAGNQNLLFPYWIEKIDQSTGEITKKSEFRLQVCGRHLVDGEWSIYSHGESVGFSGVMRCGNVWGCVFCASKIMRIQGERIGQIFDHVTSINGASFLVTYTASHQLTTPLIDQLDAFKNAKKFLIKSRSYAHIIQCRLGSVSATEITYNDRSGWHPHQHDAWFFPSGLHVDAEKLADELFDCWKNSCSKFGLETTKYFLGRRVGVDVRKAWNASEYMTKFDRERDWSLSAEMTTGRLKGSKGQSVTPWTILEYAIIHGRDSGDFKLWLEYLRATKGKSVVSLKSCRKLLLELGLPTSFDDYKDANKQGDGEVLGTFSPESFHQIIKAGGMGRVLEQARKGDFSKFIDF